VTTPVPHNTQPVAHPLPGSVTIRYVHVTQHAPWLDCEQVRVWCSMSIVLNPAVGSASMVVHNEGIITWHTPRNCNIHSISLVLLQLLYTSTLSVKNYFAWSMPMHLQYTWLRIMYMRTQLQLTPQGGLTHTHPNYCQNNKAKLSTGIWWIFCEKE
jgi:hypothetical protein